MVSEGTQVGSN